MTSHVVAEGFDLPQRGRMPLTLPWKGRCPTLNSDVGRMSCISSAARLVLWSLENAFSKVFGKGVQYSSIFPIYKVPRTKFGCTFLKPHPPPILTHVFIQWTYSKVFHENIWFKSRGFCSAHFGLTIKWPALGFAHGFGISSFLSFSWFRLKSLFLSDAAACGEQRGKMWVDFLRFLTLKEILFDLHGFPHALFLKWYTFL